MARIRAIREYFLGYFLVATIASILLSRAHADAATINVPGDQPTIQSALNAAHNGDTIVVAPGTYNENVVIAGTMLTLTSSGGPQKTTINGGKVGPVVTIGGSPAGTVVSGFTLTNGYGQFTPGLPLSGGGGGVLLMNTSATISGNIITQNEAALGGGGVMVNTGSPTIEANVISNNGEDEGSGGSGGGGILIFGSGTTMVLGNTITNNSWASGNGGGIAMNGGGQSLIMNNIISGNLATGVFDGSDNPIAGGGAISIENDASPVIVQNLIFNNTADLGGGLYLPTSGVVLSNTIANNTSTQDVGSAVYIPGDGGGFELYNNLLVGSGTQSAMYCDPSGLFAPIYENNDAYSGGALALAGLCSGATGTFGNISANPMFMNAASGDFHLTAGSPAIDAGQGGISGEPTTDYYGNPRVVAGKAGDAALIDIGAAEYQPSTPIATPVPTPAPTPIPNVIRVPLDQPTIHDAIDAASNGETVQVAPGEYFENINFEGKAITVTSTQGAASTIINGHGVGTTVTFASSETTASVLSGFTITGGIAPEQSGGGVYIFGASPTVSNNIISGNYACGGGAGIDIVAGAPFINSNTIINNQQVENCGGGGGAGIAISGGSNAQIISNKISDNSWTGGDGGGIWFSFAGSPLIMNNEISSNLATGVFGALQGIPFDPNNDAIATGGGVSIDNRSAPILVQNLIIHNQADVGGGVFVNSPATSSSPVFVNNTIYDNLSTRNIGAGLVAAGFSAFTSATGFYNNIIEQPDSQNAFYCSSGAPGFQGNDVFSQSGESYAGGCDSSIEAGNISADPLFAATSSDDYQLLAASPAIDAGTNSAPDLPALDYYGAPRIVPGTMSGTTPLIDIGIAEYQPDATPTAAPTRTATATATATIKPTATPKPTPKPRPTRTATPTPVPVSLEVLPRALNFGKVALGTTSKPRVLTVINPRTNPGVVVDPFFTSATQHFAVTGNCPALLEPKLRCRLEVTFTPAAASSAFDILFVRGARAPTPLASVNLTGTGIVPKTKPK